MRKTTLTILLAAAMLAMPAVSPAIEPPHPVPTPRFADRRVWPITLSKDTAVLLGKTLAAPEHRWIVGPLLRQCDIPAANVRAIDGPDAALPAKCVLIGGPADHAALRNIYGELSERLPAGFGQGGKVGPEAYLLDAAGLGGVGIVADTPAGAFYAVQTLLQGLDPERNSCDFTPTADAPDRPFRGIHLMARGGRNAELYERLIRDVLPRHKTNVLVFQVGYHMQFKRRPEFKVADAFTVEQIRRLAAVARQNNVKLVPMLNCLGHQSWLLNSIGPLLQVYPEFNETPGTTDIRYCYAWCPSNPKVNEVVFDLLDDMVDAFQCDTVHLGMDEVFQLGKCERCRGKGPAELFAKAVNDLHGHLAKRGVKAWIWGDRLIDGAKTPYNPMNGSRNGTHPALGMIPKDILLCDWHYHPHPGYPSAQMFDRAGFDYVSCSWNKLQPVEMFISYARQFGGPHYRGHLATNWSSDPRLVRVLLGEEVQVPDETEGTNWVAGYRQAAECYRRGMELAWHGPKPWAAVAPPDTPK